MTLRAALAGMDSAPAAGSPRLEGVNLTAVSETEERIQQRTAKFRAHHEADHMEGTEIEYVAPAPAVARRWRTVKSVAAHAVHLLQ